MAGPGARVRKRFAGFRHELPVVTGGMKGQLESTIGRCIAQLAIGGNRGDRRMIGSAGSDNQLANAACSVEDSAGRLRCKALIDVVVAVQNEIGVVVI